MSPTAGSDPYGVLDDSGPTRGASRDPSFEVLENRDVHVVKLLRREYLEGNEIERLGADLKSYFANKPQAKVVLDMGAVHQISSAALGVIMSLRTAIESDGGALRIASLRPDLTEVFAMTNLDRVLKIKAHIADAIASL